MAPKQPSMTASRMSRVGGFSIGAPSIAGFDLPLLVARRIAVAQAGQRRDPDLETAESPANVGSN